MKPGQDLTDITTDALLGLRPVLRQRHPEWVLVRGDTTTTLTPSLAAYYEKISVGHVGAALRTHNIYLPWLEDISWRIAGAVAIVQFAPTALAHDNLQQEGIDSQRRLILVAGHLRENFGASFDGICHALRDLSRRPDAQIVYPVPPNPNVQEPVRHVLGDCPRIHLIAPQDCLPFVFLMNCAHFLSTDSCAVRKKCRRSASRRWSRATAPNAPRRSSPTQFGWSEPAVTASSPRPPGCSTSPTPISS
ncbi:MAG TPA: UDP-N-acetylglucosamine 2-epimerase [Burkholderiaceae bacterium]|nr:UDP-N-acetylglucosamine 2-epimerase [Burkholderiaceae bacterium]